MTSSELQRRPDETRALARLALDELSSFPSGIGGFQRALAGRVFRYVGPTARVVQVPYDAITGGVYAGLRGASRFMAGAADQALALRPRPEGPTLSITPRGSAVIAAVNGLIGDTLEREGSVLAEPMSVRVAGEGAGGGSRCRYAWRGKRSRPRPTRSPRRSRTPRRGWSSSSTA